MFSTQKNRFAQQIVRLVEAEGVREVLPGAELEKIISANGFQINPAKTRLKTRDDSQIICGVVVNEKLNVRVKLRREIRGLLHAWQKFGPEKVQELWISKYGNPKERDFERALRGKIEFMRHIRGENDLLVWSIAERFNTLTTGPLIIYEKPIDWRGGVPRSVCVIFAESADLSLKDALSRQGTGFVIRDGYVLTNAHVACYLDGRGLEKISLHFHGLQMGDLAAEVIAQSMDLDLALLRLKDPELAAIVNSRALEFDFGATHEPGATITLAGYPNYTDDDTLHITSGHVTGTSKINQLGVFRISPNVIYGNSGGPVFNDKGKVVGIAVCGSGITDAPYSIHNGAIPSRAVRQFVETALADAASK